MEWGLGERAVKNVVHLLEAHGVRVLSLAEECAEVDASSFRQRDVPHVFLNTMKSAERSRMDAAHELGHLVLRWGHETPKGREAERQAQRFGSAFPTKPFPLLGIDSDNGAEFINDDLYRSRSRSPRSSPGSRSWAGPG